MPAIEAQLAQLGITLPTPGAPVANYVPCRNVGNLLVVSGQLATGPDGKIADRHKGKVGKDLFHEAAHEAARLCAVNILAQAKATLGDLSRIRSCIRLGGFINSAPDFNALPAVMNGASDLMVAVFGEAGKHARTTVGVAQLPLDCCVEVEAMFEVD